MVSCLLLVVLLGGGMKPVTPYVTTDAGRDWGLEEKGTTEDEMAGWHH